MISELGQFCLYYLIFSSLKHVNSILILDIVNLIYKQKQHTIWCDWYTNFIIRHCFFSGQLFKLSRKTLYLIAQT